MFGGAKEISTNRSDSPGWICCCCCCCGGGRRRRASAESQLACRRSRCRGAAEPVRQLLAQGDMTGARARADRASHGRCDGSNHRRRRRRRSGRRRRRSFSSRSPATDRRKRAVRRASPATAAARRSRRGSGGGAAHLLPGGEGRRKKRRWKHEKHAPAETRRESVRAKARLACLACLAQSLLLAPSQFFC